jgi:hypothetical protein
MSDEHQHNFEVKYKRVDGEMVYESVSQCTKCEKLAFITLDRYKLIVTYVGNGSDISYSAVVAEEKP